MPESSHSESIILSLDTSQQELSVALWSASRGTIAERVMCDGKLDLSALLLNQIDAVLVESQLKLSDIELFVTTCGPGSFTGLRTGLATIKGLAEACARRVVAVPTLHVVALREAKAGEKVVSMIPAGRSEVFVQSLRIRNDVQIEELSEPAHLSPQRAIELFREQIGLCWAGSASRLHERLIKEHAANDGRIGSVGDSTSAVCAARFGYAGWLNGASVAAAQVRAIYVRPSDAELKLKR